MRNLYILFVKSYEVYIDPHYETLKYYINESNDRRYWNQLIWCLIHPSEKWTAHHETWNRRRQSGRSQTLANTDPPPTPPPIKGKEPPPPSPPPLPSNRATIPHQESTDNNTNQDYIAENSERIIYDLLKVLGLGFGASKTEDKVQCWSMYRIYNPKKHKREHNGMTK